MRFKTITGYLRGDDLRIEKVRQSIYYPRGETSRSYFLGTTEVTAHQAIPLRKLGDNAGLSFMHCRDNDVRGSYCNLYEKWAMSDATCGASRSLNWKSLTGMEA